jgi:transposase
MDNALFHHGEQIKQMCHEASVKLLYLPLYSPDVNLIKEFFAELKAFIKKQWHKYESKPQSDFGAFLEWCVTMVGGRESSAKGHFLHAGVTIVADA